MATEKTSLLHNGFDKATKCYVNIPKHLVGDENNNYVALTHDELLKYVDDPWWQYLRKVLLIFFWAMLLVMLAAACIISIVENRQTCSTNIKLNNIGLPAQSTMYLVNSNSSTLSASPIAGSVAAPAVVGVTTKTDLTASTVNVAVKEIITTTTTTTTTTPAAVPSLSLIYKLNVD